MFHYVYKINDLRTDMFYIGVRTSSIEPDKDLGIFYFSSCSNTAFIQAQKDHPDAFEYEVIETFGDRETAVSCETRLLEESKEDPKCYNGGFHILPPTVPVGYTSTKIIRYLGQLIRIARKERKMSETDLAERMGVARATVQKIEKGEPSVAIGSYIEATVILRIPLLGGDKEHINNLTMLLSYMNQLLPNNVRGKVLEVDDDF